ncbi:MAG: ferrous iron transport protein A [Phycisphaeraceae bacterium]|nr:ferrous iron transport protein A [Phycisphaeraceae bacterium]
MDPQPPNGQPGVLQADDLTQPACCSAGPVGQGALAATAALPSTDLTTLRVGQCGIVHDLTAPDQDAERLKIMGVCVGRKVKILKRGDPLILCVWGVRIGVSARLARTILVKLEAASPAASCALPA